MRVRFTPSGRAQFLAAVTYRFFYRPLDDTAWIVAVWHGAQLPERPR